MNKSNTATLKLAHPQLYRESLSNFSQYGFQHGDGWYALVTELSQAIATAAANAGIPTASDDYPVAVQAKEKFGLLRFYVGNSTPEIEAIIAVYQNKSSEICEDCGAPGTLFRVGTWRVMCAGCDAEYLKRFKPITTEMITKISGLRDLDDNKNKAKDEDLH